MLSGRGLCEELITRPKESYRVWCVVVCNLETSRMRRPWPALGVGSQRHSPPPHKKNSGDSWVDTFLDGQINWLRERKRQMNRQTENMPYL
jgi:hypothetical protein